MNFKDVFVLAKEKKYEIYHKRVMGNPFFTSEATRLEDATQEMALVQKWLREEHKLHIEIYCNHSGWGYIITKLNGTTILEITDSVFFEEHHYALLRGINEALKLIKNDTNS